MRALPRLFLVLSLSAAMSFPAHAEEFYCEVVAVTGTATATNAAAQKTLQKGDVLGVGDWVQVGAGSSLDIAYDRGWKNMTRVESDSKLRIRSLEPADIALEDGGIHARLRALPKGSTFSVSTPSAVATVRGTEYRTTHLRGTTQIYNVSDSDVYVYGLDAAGKTQAEPVVIHRSQKTQVAAPGKAPEIPAPMAPEELERTADVSAEIEKQAAENPVQQPLEEIEDAETLKTEQAERRIPEILSGDEAREAVQIVVGSAPEASSVPETPAQPEEPVLTPPAAGENAPVSEPAAEARVQAEPARTAQEVRDFTDAELGPAPSEDKMKQMIENLRGKDTPFDPAKVEALRKQVEQEIESSSPEKKAMLKKLQQQVNETVQRLVREREKLGAAKDEK